MASRADGPSGLVQATFEGSKSMRENYEQGVDSYYQEHGAGYRNPHFPGIIAATSEIMGVWSKHFKETYTMPSTNEHEPHASSTISMQQGQDDARDKPVVTVLDLACGSGEASQAIHMWWCGGRSRRQAPHRSAEPSSTQLSGAAQIDQQTAQHQIQQPSYQELPHPSQRTQHSAGQESDQGQQQLLPEGRGHITDGPSHSEPLREVGSGSGGEEVGALAQQMQCSSLGDPETPSRDEAAGEAGSGAVQGRPQAVPAAGADATPGTEDASTGSADGSTDGAGQQDTPPTTSAPALPRFTPCSNPNFPPSLHLCIDAADPYTHEAYRTWTGCSAETYSFQDVADGWLCDRSYHLVVSSYALHVLDASKLFATLMQLSLVAGHLLVLSPHKKPIIEPHTGWELVEHVVVERVHARLYVSLNCLKCDELQEMVAGDRQPDW